MCRRINASAQAMATAVCTRHSFDGTPERTTNSGGAATLAGGTSEDGGVVAVAAVAGVDTFVAARMLRLPERKRSTLIGGSALSERLLMQGELQAEEECV